MFKTKPTVLDLCFSAGVILIALSLLLVPAFFQETGQRLAVITPDGTQTYDLSRDQILSVESRGVHLEIVIESGTAYVRESTCPDQVCRNSGKISKSGQMLLCVPAGVTLRVEGGDADVDFVAG